METSPASSALILLWDKKSYWWQRRALDDDSHPACLDFAAGGGIEPGETPAQAAERELEEELGVTGLTLEALGARVLDGEVCALFAAPLPKAWRLGPEVAELLPLSLTALMALPREQLHPQLAQWLGSLPTQAHNC
ncbi:NUDIX domain-containing protein [Chromobacterium sp. IIBBL 290-4]|uniref:NUDIX domain-containing protein n=1 Tax=Chromobacterium sp. IIBBL 290-4 TaxID=2953890 RepID=UPI0020B72E52|nr:NUDIX domain-containing protein [Chromobacterium sp. IIBBL 290-4]UTH76548.1 NUDIX domain-containing protein [Chromobacterium sp. IIBBL 290-4]